MSGGSMEYIYYRLVQAAHLLEETCEDEECELDDEGIELRRKLANLLDECATCLHDIEWSDSGDYHPDEWKKPTRKLLERTNFI